MSIRRQCELCGVNRSGLYYEPLDESELNLELMRQIDEQYLKTPFHGSRRMADFLCRKHYSINRKRVQMLMRLMGIAAIYPKPRLSWRNDEHEVYPYLLRNVAIVRPDQVWSAEFSAGSSVVVERYTVEELAGCVDTHTVTCNGETYPLLEYSEIKTDRSGFPPLAGASVIGGTCPLRSRVAVGPFIAVNCGAITETLLESELF